MSAPRANIDDVAKEAGVSVATVSRALRGMPNVAVSTRARVAEAARSLGYQPHTAAASLASGRTMTIGFVAPNFDIWYTGQVLAGIESVMSTAGYDLVVYAVDTPENRATFLDRVASLQTRVDGLVLVDFFPDADQVARLARASIDVVAIGEHLDPFTSLAIDNEAAAHEGVSWLIELGHRRIALVAELGPTGHDSPVLSARRSGYLAAHIDAGLPVDTALELLGRLSVDGGADALDRIATLRSPPTALFCVSDETALGAMGRARERGVRIPEDLSVLGFDDHDLAAASGLTTVRQPVRDIGRRAARLLLEVVDAETPEVHHIDIPVELIRRDSTRQVSH